MDAETLRERIADALMSVATDEEYYRTLGPRGAALYAADRILALLPAPEAREGARLTKERDEARGYANRWVEAAMRHYPPTLAFDPVAPEAMIANIARAALAPENNSQQEKDHG